MQKRLIPRCHTCWYHVSCREAIAETYDTCQLVKMVEIARKQPIQLVNSAERAQLAGFTWCSLAQTCVSEQGSVDATPAHVTLRSKDLHSVSARSTWTESRRNQGEISCIWRRSPPAPVGSAAMRLISLPDIFQQRSAFARGRGAVHSKREHSITSIWAAARSVSAGARATPPAQPRIAEHCHRCPRVQGPAQLP